MVPVAQRKAVQEYLESIGETELAEHIVSALEEAEYEPDTWVSELQMMKEEGILGQFLGVADSHRFNTSAAPSADQIAQAQAQAQALIGGAIPSMDLSGLDEAATAEEDDDAPIELGGATPGVIKLGGATPGAVNRPTSAPPASETFGVRRALEPGQSMLHLVLVDEDWECSVTLRIFMDDGTTCCLRPLLAPRSLLLGARCLLLAPCCLLLAPWASLTADLL